jgi:ribonuclease III
MEAADPQELERRLGYTFARRELLEEALRHSSFVNEQTIAGLRDNERLEFLGDAVLNLVISHLLMESGPKYQEGELSRVRAGIVSEAGLETIARALDLGRHLRLGKGESHSHGRDKRSILADALEAVIAAVYLDGGYSEVFDLIRSHFAAYLRSDPADAAGKNYKSRLQELLQERQDEIPVYAVVREDGPDHDKTFWVRLRLPGLETEGCGKSKKLAEQDAAHKALEQLTEK